MRGFIESGTLLLVLLNPFALSAYLIELIRTLDSATFRRVVLRAALISGAVFSAFALSGNAFFESILQVRFAAFQIFGGIIFLVIAVRFVVLGGQTLEGLRGVNPEHLAGAVAMPFMIGPGTVSGSVVVGSHHGALGVLSIAGALVVTVAWLLIAKLLHDHLRARDSKLVARYVEIVGRVTALVIGTLAVEMLLDGISAWGGIGRLK
jgi:small neutral amino acid transporter SnatA (MarC family)